MNADPLAPIHYQYALDCAPRIAFAVYTERISEWWDPRYTANSESLKAVTIEPFVGGRIYATHEDIGEDEWGRIIVWETGQRLVHTFTLAQAEEHPSEVAVQFIPMERSQGLTCTMEFSHGGWTPDNVAARAKFGDWPIMLDKFGALIGRQGDDVQGAAGNITATLRSTWLNASLAGRTGLPVETEQLRDRIGEVTGHDHE